MSIFRRLSALGGVVAFARSPQGRQLIDKARVMASDPANRAKAAGLLSKIRQPKGRSY
ncbi:hypothetical protein ACVBEQ_07795 [Nakamurella sp. GG22]